MNTFFIPNQIEEGKIQIIQQSSLRNEFTLIRASDTMMKKSIMDANDSLRRILKDSSILNYSSINQGEKIKQKTLVLHNSIREHESSFYRPITKKGDPRFWIYGLSKIIKAGDLVYFTTYENKLLAIPLIDVEGVDFKQLINDHFKNDTDDEILNDLVAKISKIKNDGWILSAKPYSSSDKDVGETLEKALGLSINNIKEADYKGLIEIKCKRSKSKTRNGLFAQVPDWSLSKYPSAKEFLLNYGIPSIRHPGYKTLYVTVKRTPANPQGFYLDLDDEREYLVQMNNKTSINHEMCVWKYGKLKERLFEKHPQTVWIQADEKKENGKTYFKYQSIIFTRKPLFNQFLLLLNQSLITLDWTHRVKLDETGYNDHGFLFKIGSKDRPKLFGESKSISI